MVVDEPIFHPQFIIGLLENQKYHKCIGILGVDEGYGKTKDFKHSIGLFKLFGIKGSLFLGSKKIYYKIISQINREFLRNLRNIAFYYKNDHFHIKDVNSTITKKIIADLSPDVIISSQGNIFDSELLNIPKFGCINRHCSFLPNYKGLFPIFWALLNQEKHVGASVHYMTENLDSGGIIYQEKIPVEPKDTMVSLYKKCFTLSINVTLEAMNRIQLKSEGRLIKMGDNNGGTYYGFPKKLDRENFKKKKLRII